jgi:hypothetical protein
MVETRVELACISFSAQRCVILAVTSHLLNLGNVLLSKHISSYLFQECTQ